MRANEILGLGALALGALLSAACGGNVAVTGSGGQGTTTSHPTTSSSSGTTSVTGTGGGSICGGFAGTACPAGTYCDFPDNQCGGNDGAGTCAPRPQGCNDLYAPVCGCDGQVYGNACSAQSSGVDVDDNGGCKAPTGYFGCGSAFCFLGMEYCQMLGSDIGGTPNGYQCLPLPAGCGAAPSCACLAQETCGGNCTPTVDGGLKAVCLGG